MGATGWQTAAMRRLLVAVLLALAAGQAAALTWFLVAQWYENGNQMCKYSNGTVLNVGIRLCPLSIED